MVLLRAERRFSQPGDIHVPASRRFTQRKPIGADPARRAEALEAIADHFERVEKGEEVSKTREDLRQVEKDLGIKEQVDEQFAQAERLAELAKLSAQR